CAELGNNFARASKDQALTNVHHRAKANTAESVAGDVVEAVISPQEPGGVAEGAAAKHLGRTRNRTAAFALNPSTVGQWDSRPIFDSPWRHQFFFLFSSHRKE